MVTIKQCESCTQLCQDLTRFYIPIYLVRFDARTGYLIMLAGEEMELQIKPDGVWDYLP